MSNKRHYYAKAIELYEQAIAKGDAFAMHNRACMHQNGQGGSVNYVKAIELYEQAIAKGDAFAMNNRAYMHEKGMGGDVDYAKAIELYEQAIAKGNTFAMNNRALMHEKGTGGDVDYAEALKLYESVVGKGKPFSKCYRVWMRNHGGEELLKNLLLNIDNISIKNIKTAEDLFNSIRNGTKDTQGRNNPFVLTAIDNFSKRKEVLSKIKEYSQDEVGFSVFVKRYFSEYIGALINNLTYCFPTLGWGDYLRRSNQTVMKDLIVEKVSHDEGIKVPRHPSNRRKLL
jgi:TPR repeat protein